MNRYFSSLVEQSINRSQEATLAYSVSQIQACVNT